MIDVRAALEIIMKCKSEKRSLTGRDERMNDTNLLSELQCIICATVERIIHSDS